MSQPYDATLTGWLAGVDGANHADGDAMELDAGDKPAPTPANQPVSVAS